MVTMELKSAQQLIRILHEEKVLVDEINLRNHENLLPKIHQDTEANLKKKLRSKNMYEKSDKIGKVKHKIRILGDSNARGLAKELKYRLNQEFEVQGVIKPGSTLEKTDY
jgi:hypothetical protein